MEPIEKGDDRGGFKIVLDSAARIVELTFRGTWSLEIGFEFCDAIVKTGKRLVGRPWDIVADCRQFGTQSPEVAQMRQRAMAELTALGCKAIAPVGSALYAIQFRRIANTSHMGHAVFLDLETARNWAIGELRKR
jgi:hypothetical protein